MEFIIFFLASSFFILFPKKDYRSRLDNFVENVNEGDSVNVFGYYKDQHGYVQGFLRISHNEKEIFNEPVYEKYAPVSQSNLAISKARGELCKIGLDLRDKLSKKGVNFRIDIT
jgi:hypothetical protein